MVLDDLKRDLLPHELVELGKSNQSVSYCYGVSLQF
jgi:hypothetical protein